ncbi:hypothetical protein LP420_35695 [Massilia sp. B-10]|nr:hypothetical protein LP420_35695 [Massilia sp. B-10]
MVQMDEVTQQNAALVEESAAAAASLQEQAVALARTVSIFVLPNGNQDSRPALKAVPAARPHRRPAPPRQPNACPVRVRCGWPRSKRRRQRLDQFLRAAPGD